MKPNCSGLTRQYRAALKSYLKVGKDAPKRFALEIGNQAVALELETGEMLTIHERVLRSLKLPASDKKTIRHAHGFYLETVKPMIRALRADRRSLRDTHSLSGIFRQHSEKLHVKNGKLKRSVLQGKRVEVALKKSAAHLEGLLIDSLGLQERLRQLTRRNLSIQEAERQTMGRQLRDEIAQTLLAVHVRLLNLKTAANGNSAKLSQQIAGTQRLVEMSVRSIKRFAEKLRIASPL